MGEELFWKGKIVVENTDPEKDFSIERWGEFFDSSDVRWTDHCDHHLVVGNKFRMYFMQKMRVYCGNITNVILLLLARGGWKSRRAAFQLQLLTAEYSVLRWLNYIILPSPRPICKNPILLPSAYYLYTFVLYLLITDWLTHFAANSTGYLWAARTQHQQ